MVNPSPSVCVAFPVESVVTLEDIRLQAQKAIKLGAKFLEFRVDYASDLLEWDSSHFEALVRPFSVPVILTMRRKEEGGHSEISEDDRIKIIMKCVDVQPAFVDMEYSLDRTVLEPLYHYATDHEVGVLYSYHDFVSTPSLDEAQKMIETMLACPGFDCDENPNLALKLIFSAESETDNYVPLALCDQVSQKAQKIVSFCMGQMGIYSRVMSLRHGAFFSFASFGSATAPGQVSLGDFESLYQNDQNLWDKYGFNKKLLAKLNAQK